MSGKFMKTKRVILPTLVLVALLAQSSTAFALSPGEVADMVNTSPTVTMEMADVQAISSAAPVVRDNGDGTYTVISNGEKTTVDKKGDVIVESTPKTVLASNQATAGKVSLSDINSHWGKADIQFLVDKGAIKGYSDGTFKPNQNITRSEFTSIVVRLLDQDNSKVNALKNGVAQSEGEKPLTLQDIQSKGFTWEAEAVLAAYYNGSGSFWDLTPTEWNKPINRGEMAAVIVNLSKGLSGTELALKDNINKAITDYSTVANTPYTDAIMRCFSNGIVSGDQNHNYNPKNNGTRAESCAIISRLVDTTRRAEVSIPSTPQVPTDPSSQTEAGTIKQSDPYRRSVQEGDKFITTSGETIIVKKNATTGTFNPEAAVGFDLGRTSLDGAVIVGSTSDGNDGGVLGDRMIKGPNGHIAWTSEWGQIYNSGWDKPTTPGTKDGQRSPNKLYFWSTEYEVWSADNDIASRL